LKLATPAFSGDPQLATTEADWLAAHFEACSLEYRAMLESAGIRQGDHVVDVGCGSGQFLGWIGDLAGTRGRVTGIDISLDNLLRAREQLATGRMRSGVIGADALMLPLAAGSVDLVWCANTFEYLTADEQAAYLREMIRVLRPGGIAAVKDSEFTHKIFHPVPVQFWFDFLLHLSREGGGAPFVGRALPGAFKRAGLTPSVRTFLTERTAPLSDAECRWISMSGRAIAADAASWMASERADEAAAFGRLFDEREAGCVLLRDDFYYCEGSIVVTARTPE